MNSNITEELQHRVLVLDGAMGTMIQRHSLTESDFRGERFATHPGVLKGCNDLLTLTRPDVIGAIHADYLGAGADIIETDTFNANAISLSEYGLGSYVREINLAGARLAREAVERHHRATGRRAYVAGSVGPSNVSLSLPVEADGDPVVDFDAMAQAYREQCAALIEGGVDVILLETIFDTLNAKAAIYGLEQAMADCGRRVPVMISVTLTESGRTLSGQTVEAFLASVEHVAPLSVGLNCGFGAEGMAPWLERLQSAPYYISLYPNAGLPDEMGRYSETPERMAATVGEYLGRGLVNIIGGCCGTTPAHIAAIAALAAKAEPRKVPARDGHLRTAGLDVLDVDAHGFVKVGERCNVAGSRKFLRLVNEGSYAEALTIAAGQIGKGAAMLDVNMDDGLLDAATEMERFTAMLGLDASTAAVPVMIDSSDFDVIRRGLRKVQGRAVVNSISLKEGEAKFLEHARELKALGAAVVVMAFDEMGQATTFARRVEILSRAYNLLTTHAGLCPEEIIFDPNVLTVATGIPEHDRYALDFLEAVEWIKANLPGAKVSGGVSNLSFAFRGNNRLREAMHTVFLHHAIARGMDMAIVNPTTSLDINTIEPELREAIEDVIFCRDANAAVRLTEIADRMMAQAEAAKAPAKAPKPEAAEPTLAEMVMTGRTDRLEELLAEAMQQDGSAMAVIKGRLMDGMNRVGEAFGAGRMFLPQVVRSAGVMKQAIAWLTPHIEREAAAENIDGTSACKRMVLATVKGDVHDIGKNIVAVVLRCSGFEVIDLGVMVPADRIVAAVRETGAKFVGLSGLITPSLSEMAEVARRLQTEGLTDVALFVGGATTSALHTAVKIAPEFSGVVFHTRDAASLPDVAGRVADEATRMAITAENREAQATLRNEYAQRSSGRAAAADIPRAKAVAESMPAPAVAGRSDFSVPVSELIELINWKAFLHVWDIPVRDASSEAERLLGDARAILSEFVAEGVSISARVVLAEAHREDLDLVIGGTRIPTLRQESGAGHAVADFVAEADDHAGVFAVTVGHAVQSKIDSATDPYRHLLLQSLADRLVEAATEWLHRRVHEQLWALGNRKRGPRPAVGYPSLPDQTITHLLAPLLDYAGMGITLTENGALNPSATTTGFMFAAPEACYFEVGPVSDEAKADYARRRGLPLSRITDLLPRS
ncbi:MAG: methionine synthase [Bacteroidales bacterium]|nr:methionine synthase [Bacteroidales bacterium]